MSNTQKLQVLPVLALLCILVSCESKNFETYDKVVASDTIALAYDPDTVSITEEQHKLLVRKASVNMKVKDIQNSSENIRKLTQKLGGEIWNSHWHTEENQMLHKKISADSLLTITNLKQYHDLTLRIPSQKMDSLLCSIETEGDVLIEKIISTENVGLEHLSNDLKTKNFLKSNQRHDKALTQKKSDLEQHTLAESYQTSMTENIVDYQIRNLKLQEESKFSYIEVSLVQDQNIHQTLTYTPDPEKFDPPYYAEIWTALADGMKFISALFLFLIRIWPLYIIAFAGWKIYLYAKGKAPIKAEVISK